MYKVTRGIITQDLKSNIGRDEDMSIVGVNSSEVRHDAPIVLCHSTLRVGRVQSENNFRKVCYWRDRAVAEAQYVLQVDILGGALRPRPLSGESCSSGGE